ncbi:TonB-dependent receptor [Novosphingobium terrae]|uniref:TonB-dependent receptor n=1 Tax=Novosphingobium terrae TaxID=2726189 RepID=UPI00197D1D6D|nr:TonB-dependent receptor [Novosphingobium terrae]
MRISHKGGLCALLLATTAMPVKAQEAPAAEKASGAGIQDIIVTAQRRSENLQRAAIAVSAVTGDALTSRGVTTTDQLSKLVPALVIQPTGGTNVNIYIRGVGAFGATPTNENAIAFAADGVFIARPGGTVGNFYDLERVEVLKGPQGTLYGRNSTGGAINLVTRKPRLGETSAELGFEVGNYSEIKSNAAVNLPLSSSMALRMAGQIVQRDGYLSRGYDDEVGQAARAQLLFKPDDKLSVLLSGDYYHQGGKGAGSVLLPDSTVPNAPSLKSRVSGADPASLAVVQAAFPGQYASLYLPQDDGYVRSSFWGVSATVDYDLGFAKLTAIPAYRESRPTYLSYRPGFHQEQTEFARQLSGELRLSSPGSNRLGYVVGLFYFNQHQNANALNQQAAGNQNQLQYDDLTTESWAAFGQATYKLTSAFRLVGGARYTSEMHDQQAQSRSPTAANLTPPYTPIDGHVTSGRVTWKAGVEWDVAPRSLLYANVATGFKSGGIGQYSTSQPALNIYKPETLTAYTMGSKNRFFDNRLQLNLEAFYWDYRNQQMAVLVPRVENTSTIAQQVINVGHARQYGLDAEIEVAVTPRDRVTLNAEYLNSKYLSFTYQLAFAAPVGSPRIGCAATQAATSPVRLFTVDCSGQPALNAPRWSLTGGYQHTFPLDADHRLIAAINSQYQTGRYLAAEYTAQEWQPAFISSDATLTLEGKGGRWSVSAWVNNLENTVIRNQVFQRTIQGSSTANGPAAVYYTGLRPPRTYGLRANFKI